ncbi:bifunctional (p)ppGpp synthetase/guanosine-3',5'-bis(diphosphate) 3'-pyrophosphohydrolase [bacterium]|nr:bifunctional (p)ppGpp synthetase/guanosine-3',5'-bis(diphosphate) 3'-pyrophosphohydrolase [bacterium]
MIEKHQALFDTELRPVLSLYLSKEEIQETERAFQFADNFHQGQLRKSMEPYIIHPLEVAKILAEHKAPISVLIAGLLHDSIEDTDADEKIIKKEFGADIAELVTQLTHLQNIDFSSEEEGQVENLRKLLLAMASDMRVVLIKIADRLHNMRTLSHLSTEKQKKIALETMEIYVPLVHRLGMYAFKWEMEDLAFKYLYPVDYKKLKQMVSKKREDREDYIQMVIEDLTEELTKNDLKFKIEGRPKNLYSTYKKMEREFKDISEIYDLFATRVLVETVTDCYFVLGIIHNLWRPVPGRIKDYIANPKPNGYRSLHTTVFGPDDELIEIQIRTFEMHQNNEVGIANHWSYKEGPSDKDFNEKVSWLRQLLDMQSEATDAKDFVSSVKLNLFKDEIFVFTPKGRVIDLPAGATPIDFAYRIHSDIGNTCVGAKVNGRIAPLNTKLQTGDRVQILTNKTSKGPGRDWLKIVRSPSTRAKIRAWFRKIDEPLEEDEDKEEEIKKVLVTSPIKIKVKKRNSNNHLVVLGDDDIELPVFFPKCCNPVPYDEIIGYISRGRGITIHRKDCTNLNSLMRDKERMIIARWRSTENATFSAGLSIKVKDEQGVLSKISQAISEQGLNVLDFRASASTKNYAKISAKVEVKDLSDLEKLIDKLSKIACVEKVKRA